ncbi:MAG: MltA domain-containing protein [Thiothrix litoralis]|jgi:membrane-bound lytic murein transglycosylase A|uniref:MltA domain-containing protein n=1 Tax=Thiothrix litoralis TaxID=2891210 RepID=UPI003C74C893
MLLKYAWLAGICLFASHTNAQTTTTPLPPACNVQPQGKVVTPTENCIRKTPALREGLVDLAVYLQTTTPSRLIAPEYQGKLDVSQLQDTATQLIHWLDSAPDTRLPLEKQFSLQALGNTTAKRPVQYGGYYTPMLEVSATPTDTYQYPIYDKPASGLLPSRRTIMQGALHGKGLEIAWTNDPVGYYFMQVQGSGLIRYPDGHTQLLGFAGKNSYPYASIGRYMQQKGYLRTNNLSNTAVSEWLKLNPDKLDEVLNASQSFVFFHPVSDVVRSSSGLPVVAGHTVSVDTSLIPLGSILLAELALRDNNGKIVQHEWRLLLATDRRSDDRGVTRIGIYTGEGDEGRAAAQHFFPAGRAFILRTGS